MYHSPIELAGASKHLEQTHPIGNGFGVAVYNIPQFQVTGPRLELGLGVDAAIREILVVKIMFNGRKIRRFLDLLGFFCLTLGNFGYVLLCS